MYKYLIVTNEEKEFVNPGGATLVVSAEDFISGSSNLNLKKLSNLKVINLCNDYDYLSVGYHCSLLADARGMKSVPSVKNIISLNWKRFYKSVLPELNSLLNKAALKPAEEPLKRSYLIYFGRTESENIELLGRRVFDLFRFPIIELEIEYKNSWVVANLSPVSLGKLPVEKKVFFKNALDSFTGSRWREQNSKNLDYWIAILYDKNDPLSPSNKVALNKFIKAGKKLNAHVEVISKNDYASLLEFDALLIRATTSIENYTFQFAYKAAAEDIPCIDDVESIIKCSNKVFLFEMLKANNILAPKTVTVSKKNVKNLTSIFSYPIVLKIPDGSFSRGLAKVNSEADLNKEAAALFKKSEILIAQEFMPSEFDWRIGVLNGEPLYACKYFMAKDHWQIYNHNSKKKSELSGGFEAVTIDKVPEYILSAAVKSASLIGRGLYGVDLKEMNKKAYVIEVNDNPDIVSGVEDFVLGDALYERIIKRLIDMIKK